MQKSSVRSVQNTKLLQCFELKGMRQFRRNWKNMPKMLIEDGNTERKNLEGKYESKEDDNPENVLGWSKSLLKLCFKSSPCCIS